MCYTQNFLTYFFKIMRNLNTLPTRATFEFLSTSIDPIAISNQINLHECGIWKKRISDHFTNSNPFKRRIRKYKNADFTKLNNHITLHDWSFLYANSDDDFCEKFIHILLELADLFGKVRPECNPCYNSEIRKCSRKRDKY